MRITFAGTRANITLSSARHRRHSALLVSDGARRLLVDCGADWLGRLHRLRPTALLITHAHPDHAGGLRDGSPCPVWATEAAWRTMCTMPIARRRIIRCDRGHRIAGFGVRAVPVVHSRRCPAVAYRITASRRTILYAPDVLSIPALPAALRGVDLYIGDGSSITRPIVQGRGAARSGHASIAMQLGWCAAAAPCRAMFTHCGSALVRMGWREASATVTALGREHGLEAALAYDGLTIELR